MLGIFARSIYSPAMTSGDDDKRALGHSLGGQSGSRMTKVALISAGVIVAAAIIAFLVAVFMMGSPAEHGQSRSAPHSTTN